MSAREWDDDVDRGERIPEYEDGWSSIRCACGALMLVDHWGCAICEAAEDDE